MKGIPRASIYKCLHVATVIIILCTVHCWCLKVALHKTKLYDLLVMKVQVVWQPYSDASNTNNSTGDFTNDSTNISTKNYAWFDAEKGTVGNTKQSILKEANPNAKLCHLSNLV